MNGPPSPINYDGRSDAMLVFKKFLKYGTNIATAVPSSRWLARSLIRGIDFDTVNTIVELGAGTGPITLEILKRLKPHTRFFVVEIDPDFCARLRQRFPKLDIVHGDAAHLDQLLADRGLKNCDCVVSGLPIPSFPRPLQEAVMGAASRAMGPNGIFRQLTVMPLVYWKTYSRFWDYVEFKFVPLNLPPAGVYLCKGFKAINR
ncbi:MAG: methyltransferase domain-containing protein [Gemmataceae bacterium]